MKSLLRSGAALVTAAVLGGGIVLAGTAQARVPQMELGHNRFAQPATIRNVFLTITRIHGGRGVPSARGWEREPSAG